MTACNDSTSIQLLQMVSHKWLWCGVNICNCLDLDLNSIVVTYIIAVKYVICLSIETFSRNFMLHCRLPSYPHSLPAVCYCQLCPSLDRCNADKLHSALEAKQTFSFSSQTMNGVISTPPKETVSTLLGIGAPLTKRFHGEACSCHLHNHTAWLAFKAGKSVSALSLEPFFITCLMRYVVVLVLLPLFISAC